MVFYLIGLGLGDEKDITVKGLEAVQKCTRIYLEAYTSILGVNKDKLVCLKNWDEDEMISKSYCYAELSNNYVMY